MFDRGVRNHLLASRCAAPLMVRAKRGLIVTTTFWDRGRYLRGNLFYDLAKASMTRLAFGMAEELRRTAWPRSRCRRAGCAPSSCWPATRPTRRIGRSGPALARTESPRYLGRAVAALAGDPQVMAKSGEVLRVADLARDYGFTDIDGRQVEGLRDVKMQR
jgi:NAD(P)-dependent dehydrogenase (short-subunit alcohol dehydrogenase family)